MKKGKKIIIGFLVILLSLISAFWVYTLDYYHADKSALEAPSIESGVTISQVNGAIVYDPGHADTALIFYPGGKVEYSAYQPLMIQIAQQGILCILPRMPFNLAVFNIRAADPFMAENQSITHWYVGGHSLGGSMAASYAAGHATQVDGLVLLAAYSTADLASSGLRVLSIYGDQDGVLNHTSYQKYRKNLPADLVEIIVAGGNHAGFGNYGPQQGDGNATMTPEQQQQKTAQAIAEFFASSR
ncbi:MAG: alpha/beta hydrolase [Eubacteriales bacterium]|nr:alpha/beta hydrolase [Eubacteriales bacterium]